MKAAQARKLKVGDWVRAQFGIHSKVCQISAIDWPEFTLQTRDHKADPMVRTRRYQAIYSCDSEGNSDPTIPSKPSWIKMSDSEWADWIRRP